MIISLLDLHISPYHSEGCGAPYEIFEAGTGHGALTLHLSRAIHGANSGPLPSLNDAEAYQAWLSNRKAVIQTLDISPAISSHAQEVVRNFRQGMYFPNIDFHVGGVDEYLSSRLVGAPEPFLEHAILDLPSCHEYLEIVGRSLKPNGSLLVFCPSITQINTCVQRIKDKMLPFLLESVLETGAGAGAGGREWDVRLVKPRSFEKAKAAIAAESDLVEHERENVNNAEDDQKTDQGWEMVCRPKVGIRVVGGGFLGFWRRMTSVSSKVM